MVEPGFFSSAPVHVATVVGGAAAVVSAVVGGFAVLRGQSFAGHALTDVTTAGGSTALLIGLSPLTGFVVLGVLGGGAMDLIGVRRVRGRDLATGIVLGAAIGLAALVLYLDTTTGATTGATQQILFGSTFTIDSSTIPLVLGLGAATLVAIACVYRRLLLSSVNSELAVARGVDDRLVGVCFVGALGVAVGLSSLAIGAILSTALLVGPAATALRLVRRFGRALLAACAIGIGSTWAGVLLAYDSYYWSPGHRALPVSFFIVAIVVAVYLVSGPISHLQRRRTSTYGR